jgi:hypothetical protein
MQISHLPLSLFRIPSKHFHQQAYVSLGAKHFHPPRPFLSLLVSISLGIPLKFPPAAQSEKHQFCNIDNLDMVYT